MRLVELVAIALGLPKFALHQYFSRPIQVMRLLHYSEKESRPQEGIFGAGAHTDYGFLTILSTDGNPGLQVLAREGTTAAGEQWVKIQPKPFDFVVNVGDFLQELTDGECHMVV